MTRDPARTAFHAALAGIFVPCIGPLASVVLAASYGLRDGAWSRRLVGLAAVDVLVLAASIYLAANRSRLPAAALEPQDLIGLGTAAAVILASWAAAWRHPGPRVWRGFILAMACFVGVGAVAAAAFDGARHGDLLILVAGHSGMGLGGLLAARWMRRDRPPEPPPRRSWLPALGWAVYYVLTCYPRLGFLLVASDLTFFDGPGRPESHLEGVAVSLSDPVGVALFVLAVVVVAPLAEEVVFRGLVLPRLAARVGREPALAATALLFGSLHTEYGIYAGLTVLLGWVLGWARLSSGGLAAPIALHMIINGVVTLLYFVR